ncbi:MAG: hypothetical protein QXT73_04810 [Candidatus Methanomethylicaceae archaeon]
MRVPFIGKLRLAKDFIQELYVHMGFQKPSAYQTVLDLLFEEGYLKKLMIGQRKWSRRGAHLKEDMKGETL